MGCGKVLWPEQKKETMAMATKTTRTKPPKVTGLKAPTGTAKIKKAWRIQFEKDQWRLDLALESMDNVLDDYHDHIGGFGARLGQMGIDVEGQAKRLDLVGKAYFKLILSLTGQVETARGLLHELVNFDWTDEELDEVPKYLG
jgi:hypothetical protein